MSKGKQTNTDSDQKELVAERVEKLIEESDLKKLCCSLETWEKNIHEIEGFTHAEKFSQILKLIANPIRLKIILILLGRDWACNCEFEYIFNIQQTLISHHLRNLRGWTPRSHQA